MAGTDWCSSWAALECTPGFWQTRGRHDRVGTTTGAHEWTVGSGASWVAVENAATRVVRRVDSQSAHQHINTALRR